MRNERRRLACAGLCGAIFSLSLLWLKAAEFWVPKDPPKARYRIEASLDLEKKALSGTVSIALVNTAARPLDRLALDWSVSGARTIEVQSLGRSLSPLGASGGAVRSTPLVYDLPAGVPPGKKVELLVRFTSADLLKSSGKEILLTDWFPRLWWGGLPVCDAFAVKIKAPEGYAMAVSGTLNPRTGLYEVEGARTFGVYLGQGLKAEERDADGTLVRALFTEKGADCARLCLETAVDAIKFYKKWLGFYPFPGLTIIPGGPEPWGGYPFATGIVVVHGQEKLASRNADFWQWITSHEIGHQYWSEYVLDPDEPSWLWIGLGIFADRQYTIASGLSAERHPGFFAEYLGGLEKGLDTTIDIPPAQERKIQWDRNNIVVHGKGFSVISALDCALGRETFLKIYRRCLKEFGGRRLGGSDFRRVAEEESGQSLAWFFEPWVRSNRYLCYKITSQASVPKNGGYSSEITVESLGTLKMPVPVRAEFEDGTSWTQAADRLLSTTVLRFESRARLKSATLDPERKLAMLKDPLPPNAADLKNQILVDLPYQGAGEEALRLYRSARQLKIADPGAWFHLGLALFDGGYFQEACESFSNLASAPADPLQHFASLAWMGMLQDLLGNRQDALAHYREALRFDTGKAMRHDQYGLVIDKAWVEERLKTPFRWEKK